MKLSPSSSGFTLIQTSMVLIVIGLVVGGILTGQSLLDAAAQRAQVTQIGKYQTAVAAFQNKYGGLPGDLADPAATSFGFQSSGPYLGERDGNNIIEGNCANAQGYNNGDEEGCGEQAVFWQDLSKAGLIDASIPIGTNQPNISGPITGNCCVKMTASPGLLTQWLPAAKLGNGNFVYVYSMNATNYFAVQFIQQIGWSAESTGNAGAGANAMTVQQAYNIDKKMDDGLPQSGNVTACDDDYDVYINAPVKWYPVWAAGKGLQGAGGTSTSLTNCVPTTAATPYASTNCFDNNNVAGAQTYSTSKNANAQNCALSFQFQQ